MEPVSGIQFRQNDIRLIEIKQKFKNGLFGLFEGWIEQRLPENCGSLCFRRYFETVKNFNKVPSPTLPVIANGVKQKGGSKLSQFEVLSIKE